MANTYATIEREELRNAALDPRITKDYDFFATVSTGIFETLGFKGHSSTSGYYDLKSRTKFIPIWPCKYLPSSNGDVRYSIATSFVRSDQEGNVIAEARFANFADYKERANFSPIFRSLTGNLGLHRRQRIHLTDLTSEEFQEDGKHPSERALDLGYLIQMPTEHGDLYLLGLGPIQDLAKLVSEKVA